MKVVKINNLLNRLDIDKCILSNYFNQIKFEYLILPFNE